MFIDIIAFGVIVFFAFWAIVAYLIVKETYRATRLIQKRKKRELENATA